MFYFFSFLCRRKQSHVSGKMQILSVHEETGAFEHFMPMSFHVKTIFKTNLVLKKIYTQLLIGLFGGIFFFLQVL